jgi:hypothetical protein
MNSNFTNLVDFEIGLIRLILEFLFGSVIELGKGKNQEALSYRLVCKKFRQAFDRLVHLSLTAPIRNRCCPPSEISSISMITKYNGYEITDQDWENVFGDKLNNVESSLRYLHINAYSIKYLPKFTCLKSILWEVDSGCYNLLKNIPRKELKITRYSFWNDSIAHLTRLSEVEIRMSSGDHKLIDKYLPSTIRRMTIKMLSYEVDVINLSKFISLKYLKIVTCYPLSKQLIEELILPTSLYELYSSVKIERINLHQCKKLEVIELK